MHAPPHAYDTNKAEHQRANQHDLKGGPTGLLSAVLLRQLGITVSVIDSKPKTLDLGRADALNARTQQYLEVAGVLDDLLGEGITCNTSSTFAAGDFTSRQSHWWTGLEHTFRRNFLMIGQPVVESVLLARLSADSGATVSYGATVTAVSETATGVEVRTDTGRVIQATYAIAADGAKSTVRTSLGIPFQGTKPEMVWAVLDTFIETDFPVCPEIVTFQRDGQSRVSWIPRERGMARFYILLDGEITQEKAETSIREHMAPHKVEFKKTEWFSTFDVKERLAGSFISLDGAGRIFLAGDAAHVHSVNGGQGLNTGMADAFGLAWRLALAVKAGSTPTAQEASRVLLKSYDTERRQVAQAVIDVAARLVRDTVHTAKQYVTTIERNAGYITGMGVSYDGLGSPLVRESEEHGFWKSGRRCPDVSFTAAGQTSPTRLYASVKYGRFLVLHIGGQSRAGTEKDLNLDGVGLGQALVEHLYISPSSSSLPGGVQKHFTADFATLDDPFVVVVRPDMYLGFVGAQDDWRDYLDKIFVRS
jgi:phenol 2-monooxygenase